MDFGSKTSDMVDFVRKILNTLKGKGMQCKFLRCDNAGEHSGLRTLCIEFRVDL